MNSDYTNENEERIVEKVLREIKEKKRNETLQINLDDIMRNDEFVLLLPLKTVLNAERALTNLFNPSQLYDLMIIVNSLVLFDKIITFPLISIEDLDKFSPHNGLMNSLFEEKKLFFLDLNLNDKIKVEIMNILRMGKYGEIIKYLLDKSPEISKIYGIQSSNILYLDSLHPAPSKTDFDSCFKSYFETYPRPFQDFAQTIQYDDREASRMIMEDFLYYLIAGLLGFSYIPSLYMIPLVKYLTTIVMSKPLINSTFTQISRLTVSIIKNTNNYLKIFKMLGIAWIRVSDTIISQKF